MISNETTCAGTIDAPHVLVFGCAQIVGVCLRMLSHDPNYNYDGGEDGNGEEDDMDTDDMDDK